MKKVVRIFLIIVLVAFIALQFFQPEKNLGEISEKHIFNVEKLPENIKTDLQNACMDCHSNNTNYLWYHKIAPVSFMINKHIIDGKEELNFSDWGDFDGFDKIAALDEINHETERKTMPLKSYAAMHSDAKLSDEQISAISLWTQKLSEKILKEFEE